MYEYIHISTSFTVKQVKPSCQAAGTCRVSSTGFYNRKSQIIWLELKSHSFNHYFCAVYCLFSGDDSILIFPLAAPDICLLQTPTVVP